MNFLIPGFAFLIYLAVLCFLALWPVLIWWHLREHTKYLAQESHYLKEIRDLLKKEPAVITGGD